MNVNTPIPHDPDPKTWTADEIATMWSRAKHPDPSNEALNQFGGHFLEFKEKVRQVVLTALDQFAAEYTGDPKMLGALDKELPVLFNGLDRHIEAMILRMYANRNLDRFPRIYYCVVCNNNIVYPDTGEDTCADCLKKV